MSDPRSRRAPTGSLVPFFADSPYDNGMMKCTRCGKEATVHDIKVVKGGIVSQIHLCEACAQSEGKTQNTMFPSAEEVANEALMQAAAAAGVPAGTSSAAASNRRVANQCPECGLSWDSFRQEGKLGCPGCYAAFESRLGPLLERAHEGGTHHVGKTPNRAKAEVDMGLRVQHLRKQLLDALSAEQYELAANLRDQITNLGYGIESDGDDNDEKGND